MPNSTQLRIIVDGITVTGEIVSLHANDITVCLLSPAGSAAERPIKALHVPHFMMAYKRNWLADSEGNLTDRGRQKAERLLTELYAANCEQDKESR